MTDIEQLIALWRERFPERAKGGEEALLGFRFQIIIALRDTVRAFLDGQGTELSVFVEKVSDILEETQNDEILFTQVKKTGRTVTSALEELWNIFVLASYKLPKLASRLRFRVLCSKWVLKDVQGAVNRWQPLESADQKLIACFKDRVSWKTDPNPFYELLALVSNGFGDDDTLQTVNSWIGRLSDPKSGAEQVWSDLHRLLKMQQRSELSRPYVWSSEDRSPEMVQRGPVLLNEQPKIKHLRDGYFAYRPLYRKLAEDAIDLISSNLQENDRAYHIQMIWLAGRSGCGKSVTLLHLLSHLNEERIGPILWLGNKVNLLPETIRRLPSIAGPNDQVIIAVDDPYAPRTQCDEKTWRDAFAELEWLQNLSTIRTPILICCGPTEQKDQLKDDFSDDVWVYTLNVPHDLEDRTALEKWFELRTGSKPPNVGSGDILLVQLFFEWNTGQPLSSFALHFRKRLEEMEPDGVLRDAVYTVIAMNRFYTGYPPTALDSRFNAKQKDAFMILLNEHHFSVNEDSERHGLWLVHPHIANALFEAWLPTDRSLNQRQAVIKRAILDQLNYGQMPQDQTATLWALARHVQTTELRRRLETDNIGNLLADIYTAWRNEHNEPISFSHLPAWISVRFAFENLHLDPDPVTEALSRLLAENKNDTGFRLTCHMLLKHQLQFTLSQQEEVTQKLMSLLKDAQEWKEWPFIASDAVLRIGSNDFCMLMESCLSKNEQQASSVLSWLLMRRNPGLNFEWICGFTVQWLRKHINNPDAAPVLSAMLRRLDLGQMRASIATIALKWAQCCFSSDQADRVLRRLLNLPVSDVVASKTVRLAFDHLEGRDLQPSSGFLLGRILRPKNIYLLGASCRGSHNLAQLAIQLGLTWLERYSGEYDIRYVADQLLRISILTDEQWSRVALMSLECLIRESHCRDANYSLLSISQRLYLLSESNKQVFLSIVRSWLDKASKDIDKFFSRKSYAAAASRLSPMLPLVAHLGDVSFQEKLEEKAKQVLSVRNNDVREVFYRATWKLLKNNAWPSRAEGISSMKRIGLLQEENELIFKLNELINSQADETSVSIMETLDTALKATEVAIASSDLKFSGFLLAKMLPIAAHISESYLVRVEALTKLLMNSPLPINKLFGFINECDKLITRDAWPSIEDAIRSLERLGLETPMTLNRLALSDVPPDRERVSKAMDLTEKLFDKMPIRAGLFLPSLLLAVDKLGDSSFSKRCHLIVQSFMDSPNVSEAIKANLSKNLKQLLGATIPYGILITIESLGLQAPWLAERARAGEFVNAEDLERHLKQAEKLIAKDFPGRAGMLLAPILYLTAQSGRTELLEQVCNVAAQMMAHRNLTPEERDGFRAECRSYSWIDLSVQDEVFLVVGIGAPRLMQFLFDNSQSVSVEELRRSLEQVDEHLQANRPFGAYIILLPALPIASQIDEKQTLDRALELACQFMNHPNANQYMLDKFLNVCVSNFQAGYWSSSDIGRNCLEKIGIKLDEGHDLSDISTIKDSDSL